MWTFPTRVLMERIESWTKCPSLQQHLQKTLCSFDRLSEAAPNTFWDVMASVGVRKKSSMKIEDIGEKRDSVKMSTMPNRRPGNESLTEESELAAALADVHKLRSQSGDEDDLLYYDKKVRRQTAKLVELAAMSRKTMFRRQTNVAKKNKNKSILPVLKEEVEPEKLIPEAKPEATKDEVLDPWSREGLVELYDAGLHVGKGLSRPPHVIPYRFLGTPDLKRDDSLLPKTFQFAKRMKFPSSGSEHRDTIQRVEGEPMVLPSTLRAACWNGERWEGTSQTAREAKRRNGFDALYTEVVKSEKRVILCKTGQYFLEGTYAPAPDEEEEKEERRASVVSELPERQHKHRPSVAKPFIPPLPLKNIPAFEQAEQLGHNQEILSAYRDESHRYATARLASPTDRTNLDNKVLLSGRTVSGLPLKACGETSLRQLGNILSSNTSFRSLQNRFNGKLMQSLRAIQTTRPYHYAREFSLKRKGAWDPYATPRRAMGLRKHLVKFGWYEDLIKMIYGTGRFPSKSEIYVVEDIRSVLDRGERYTAQRFTNLILGLGRKMMDINSTHIHQALLHVQNSLKITDLELLTDLMSNRAKLPSWLESKTPIVKEAVRNLSPQRFPMCKWVKDKNRPKTPIAKLGSLSWSKEKSSQTQVKTLPTLA